MALPVEVRPGVFADLRVTMIALSAFFGGPLVGAVAWLAGVAYRIWVGGVGTPSAVISLTIALAVGLIGQRILAGQIPRKRDIVVLAVVAAAGSSVGFMFLPATIRAAIFPEIFLAVATLTFVAITVAGFTLAGDQRRRETERQNRFYTAIIEALPDPLHAKDLRDVLSPPIRQPPP